MERSGTIGRSAAGVYRATLAGDGAPGPIEERIGRRLVRTLNPESAEGERLLRSGQVDLIGPDGMSFGCIPPGEAYRRLRERLARRLLDPAAEVDRDALREGLARLEARWARVGRT